MKNEIEKSTVITQQSTLIKDILPMLSKRVSDIVEQAVLMNAERLEELRLRADKPLMLQNYNREWFVGRDGSLQGSPEGSYIVKQEDIKTSLELMSENSIYAYQDEIKNGYITIKGGHRVGLSGRVVSDGGCVRNIKDIAGLNIRISNQIIGCSEKVMKYIIKNSSEIYNTLIVSPPQCGKTTILRDVARTLSDGFTKADFRGIKVGIVDERSEIAACLHGVPQNNVGFRTDVLDGCPKSAGMAMLIRSMSPNVIITDEIGNEGDRDAVHCVLNAGVKIVTSAHGYNVSELQSRREVLRMMEEKVFERYIVLGCVNGPGTLMEVIDGTNMKSVAGVGPYAV
jgi:stage III sporulation protein AA